MGDGQRISGLAELFVAAFNPPMATAEF